MFHQVVELNMKLSKAFFATTEDISKHHDNVPTIYNPTKVIGGGPYSKPHPCHVCIMPF